MCFPLVHGFWPTIPSAEEGIKVNVQNLQKLLTSTKQYTHHTRHKLRCQERDLNIVYCIYYLSGEPKEKYILLKFNSGSGNGENTNTVVIELGFSSVQGYCINLNLVQVIGSCLLLCKTDQTKFRELTNRFQGTQRGASVVLQTLHIKIPLKECLP